MSAARTDRIEILLPELPCRIGVLPGENARTQPVRASISVDLDLTEAGRTGDLDATLDYASVHAAARRRILAERWTLVEALAAAVLDDVLEHERVVRASVRIEKCTPPLGVGAGPVIVHMSREREEIA